MAGQRIVVLGGGFGGAAAARTLRKLLDASHSVTLIDRRRRTYLCGSLPWLIVGEREADKVSRSLGALVQRGVQYIQAEVEGIRLAEGEVHTNAGVHLFDYLVVATGAEYDWAAVPGSAEAYSFYNIETARRLRDALRRFRSGRIIIAVSGLPYKCPPAPFEAAFLMDEAFTNRGTRRDISIEVFTPEPVPLGVAGPEATNSIRAMLARRGIGLYPGETITQADVSAGKARFQSGRVEEFGLLVTVPVHRSAPQVREAGLANQSGWIPVSGSTLATQHPNVYAVGDATVIQMANGRPLPKAGVFASAGGEVAARNVAAAIGVGEGAAFAGEGHCFMEQGRGKASMVAGRFLQAGQPDVRFVPSSVRWHRKKIQFEDDWRHWKI
jgi:sulfide:quinone oxidoreductase